MDSVEPGIRGFETRKWATCMAMYLGSLTLHTGACPPANILVHARPDVLVGDQTLGCSDSRVRKAVK